MVSLRPSHAARWAQCAASPRLQEPIPDTKSDDAKEGDAAHWLAAEVLRGNFEIDELTDRQAPNGVIITGEIIEHVQTYLSVIGSEPVVVEKTQDSFSPLIAPGTPDALRVIENQGFIWDLKYGWRIVEVFRNLQLLIYAINLFAKHQWTLDSVTVTIVQPRPWHIDGRVRSWQISRDVAWGYHNKLQAWAQAAQNPHARAVTGEACRYCRALPFCEAARVAAINAVDVSMDVTNTELPPEAIGHELTTLRRAKEAVQLRLDAMEQFAIAQIDQHKHIPGWSIDRAYGREKWKDGVSTLELLSGQTLHENKPISPAQARKKGVDPQLVAQFSTTPQTGRKLVARDVSEKAKAVFGEN